MGYRLVPLLFAVIAVIVLGACGKEIGDACNTGIDCSPNGDRLCDPASKGGYCTIQGCDYSTCPDEAACIRFFTGGFENPPWDKQPDPLPPEGPRRKVCGLVEDNMTHRCSLDELCALTGQCVARSSEIRYCMRTCGSDGDCRDGYECRNLDLMKNHGGQPVLAPVRGPDGKLMDAPIDDKAPKFCAMKPVVVTP